VKRVQSSMIDGVFGTLKANVDFMAHYGLNPSSEPLEIGKKLIQGMESDVTLTGPRVYIYVKPGRFDSRNHLVFDGKFCLDFVDKSSKRAIEAAAIAFEIFHDKRISNDDFNSYLCELAYDGHFATGQIGLKGWQAIYDVDYLRMN
jgi:hypothetical protein